MVSLLLKQKSQAVWGTGRDQRKAETSRQGDTIVKVTQTGTRPSRIMKDSYDFLHSLTSKSTKYQKITQLKTLSAFTLHHRSWSRFQIRLDIHWRRTMRKAYGTRYLRWGTNKAEKCQPQTMLVRCLTATTTTGNKEKTKGSWSLTNEVHAISHKMLLGVLQKQDKHNTIRTQTPSALAFSTMW